MSIPTDAQYMSDGLYYKKGSHGFVFRWSADEWVRSTKSWNEVSRGKNELKTMIDKAHKREVKS